jgi:Domain of unknown function (DUF4345)
MRAAFQALLGSSASSCSGFPSRISRSGPQAIVGIGRLLAVVIDGAPHPFYVAMLVLELVLPPLMVVMAKRVAQQASA